MSKISGASLAVKLITNQLKDSRNTNRNSFIYFIVCYCCACYMQLVADGRRVIKDYHAVRGQLHKIHDRYYACCAEWETCMNVLYREYGMQWSPTAGNKLYEKEQQVSRKVDEVWKQVVYVCVCCVCVCACVCMCV